MKNNRRFIFLINPVAGTRAKDGLERFIARRCAEDGVAYQIIQSTKSTTSDMLEFQIFDFKATDIVACGGDGTVNLAAQAAMNTFINLGVIPVGSGNGLARTAHIPLKPSRAWEVILHGKLQKTDAFSINGHFGCMLSGVGFDAAVAERFAHSHRRGLFTYATNTLIQYFKAHPQQFEIRMEGLHFFSDAFFISIANSNQFGNNVTIAPLASLNDGMLDVIIVQKMPKAALPFALLRQIRHNGHLKKWMDDIGKKNILYFQTPSISISNPSHAPLHIDGDPAATAPHLHYKILPNAFHLWVPQEHSHPASLAQGG
jgi:YegS/Rv2252/BmrU family lipid kinase